MSIQGKPTYTPTQIAKVLHYDPVNGSFTWCSTSKTRRITAGDVVNGRHNGLLSVRFGADRYACHKLAWYLSYGVWPLQVSFVDGNGDNLRLGNLHPIRYMKLVRRWRVVARHEFSELPESIYMDYLADYQRIGYKLRQGGLTYEQSERHIMIMGLPALLRPLPLPPDIEPEGVAIADTLSEDEVQALLDE